MGGWGSGRREAYQHERKTRIGESLEDFRLIEMQRRGLLTPGNTFHWGFGWFCHWADERFKKALHEMVKETGALYVEVREWVSFAPGEEDWTGLPCSLVVTHLWANGGYRDRAPVEVIDIEPTPCTFGGHRLWLLCPDCGKRRTALFARVTDQETGKYRPGLSCRVCLGIAYDSQSERTVSRAARKAKRLRFRLGGLFAMNLMTRLPDRPKGMHWNTYFRLATKANEAAQVVYDHYRAENAASEVRMERWQVSLERWLVQAGREARRTARARRQSDRSE